MLFTFSGCSGAGKSTIIQHLRTSIGTFDLPSYTTRPKRISDCNNIYYRFIDNNQYEGLSSQGDFALQASFCGQKYGTKKTDLQRAITDANLWTADLISTSVLEIIRLGFVPSRSFFLYVPKLESKARQLERGDDLNKIEERQTAYTMELECAIKLATVAPNLTFVDATMDLTSVKQLILSFIPAK